MSAPAQLFPPDRADLIRSGRREGVRFVLEAPAWASLARDGARSEQLPLLALWGDASGHVHALFHDRRVRGLIASVAVEAGRYHALSARMEAAAPYERLIRDLWGFEAMHARDERSLLDHGVWGATAPMAARPGPAPRSPEPPEWRAEEDDWVAFVETGPVGLPGWSGVRQRVTDLGGVARRVELQHGFGHRGALAAAVGLTPDLAARLAERLAGGAGVGHAVAFARAVEMATGTKAPRAAVMWREMAGEMERAMGFAGTLGLAAAAGGAARLAGECAILLEQLRICAAAAFGHRFGAGLVVPGGVTRAPDEAALLALASAGDAIGRRLGDLARLYEARDGLATRVAGIGVVTPAEAAARAASGIVGRASGQVNDSRRGLALAPVELRSSELGCADQRLRLRLAGIGEAGVRIRRLVEALEAGPVRVGLGVLAAGGEGLGQAEAPEGEVWHFVRLAADGTVASWFPRDPSMAHLDLFEAACAGADVEDVAVIRASFGLASGGIDL